MSLRECLLLAVAGLLVGPPSPAAQKMAADPDVTEGVRLVETGDYDAAILTLDNAARRLAADPARVRELSQAYLYLGIAYLGKGHEAAARAKFREAVTQVRDLTLSPDEFPPKVIDLFEAARAEAMKAPASPAPQAVTSAPAPTEKKGSSKTLLLIGGVGGAAALAGIALAGGGGGGSAPGSSTPAPTPTPAPVTVEDLSGFLPATEGSRHFPIRVRAAGTVLAELSWTAPPGQPVELVMQLKDAAGRDLALSNRTAPSAAVLRADVVAQEYDLSVFYGPECPRCEAQFRLLVTHP
jgi:tetratricopeptide (TPR) repeat protein